MSLDVDTPPLTKIGGPIYRIVSSRFPPVGLWDRIADPADFDALAAIESLTNERLREELGVLARIPYHRRVAGPGTSPIMAAFTHLNADGSRFSDGTYGVFYAARAEATAIRETVFHRERFLAATTQPAQQITVRCYVSSTIRPLHDIRIGHDGLHDPDPSSYPVSAAFARTLRLENSEGIGYRSVRHAGGECVAVFWPDNLAPCVQGAHYACHWNGTIIAAVSRMESVPLVHNPATIRCFLTARDTGDRLTEQPALVPQAGGPGLPTVTVNTGRTFQQIVGFGGAFTEAAAVVWLGLSRARRQQLLEAYFDPTHGHGYSLCRVHMGSCDFALGNYAHVETADDMELASFTIERDRQALLPFIRAAQEVAGAPLKLLASPWSPPAWMKTSGRMNGGGKLRPECARAWARCYVRFIEAYAAAGVPIWGVSVQNEPMATQRWDSCLYTAEEERDFVRDHLGPEMEAAGLGQVKIVIWDHNRDLMVERANAVYSDPDAARYVWGTGFHWYGDDCFDHVQQVHDAWPDKQLLFTEGCQEGGPHHGSWELGERYARSMINDLNRWTVGWIDWNLVLDNEGGPNHVGNFCSAPVHADATADTFSLQSSYYYLGHFARFVRPGAHRVSCATSLRDIEATAFENVDGTVAIVVMNRTEQWLRLALELDDTNSVIELPPRSIATYLA